MNPDELKAAWRAQTAQTRVTIDADLLLKEVRHSHTSLTGLIFWRDFREIGISLVMVPVLLFLGIKGHLPWTWYLLVPAMLWIAGFMLVDHRRHRTRPPEPGEPLGRVVEASLAQVEHQIWLLRNVLWWYLLPPGVTILAFFAQVAWEFRSGGWLVLRGIVVIGALEVLFFAGVYWLNQRGVRSGLEPRRQELLALLAALKDNGHS